MGSMVPETMTGILTAGFVHETPDADERGLDVSGVLRGFDEQNIGAASIERLRLIVEILHELRETSRRR